MLNKSKLYSRRKMIFNVTIPVLFSFEMLLSFSVVFFLLNTSTANPLYNNFVYSLFSAVLCPIILHAAYTVLYIMCGRYFTRSVKDNEWNYIKSKNLIHYTNHLSGDVVKENKVTGIIQLHGNSSFRSNYSMKRGESGDKFVWFHLCDERNENEPYFPSFKNAHLLENGPRTYKVIIPASELQRENVYIRPWDKAIVVKGNYEGRASIETSFNWFDDRKYYRHCIVPINAFFLMFYVSYRQLTGAAKDKKLKLNAAVD